MKEINISENKKIYISEEASEIDYESLYDNNDLSQTTLTNLKKHNIISNLESLILILYFKCENSDQKNEITGILKTIKYGSEIEVKFQCNTKLLFFALQKHDSSLQLKQIKILSKNECIYSAEIQSVKTYKMKKIDNNSVECKMIVNKKHI